MENEPILRPINYGDSLAGIGVYITECQNEKVAIINVMGCFGMPMTPNNPFITIQQELQKLQNQNIKNIIIDFHAEATSEKRALMAMLKGKVSAICGTHTHIGTDDLEINDNTCYITDIGLSGANDGIIGMREEEPIQRFLTGKSNAFNVIKESDFKILQMVIFELQDGKCINAQKLKFYSHNKSIVLNDAIIF